MLLPDTSIKSILTKNGLDEKTITGLETFATNSRISLQEAAIEKDAITDEALGRLIADSLSVPFVTLKTMTIAEDIFRLVPERLARKYKIVVFENAADGVKLAMSDPTVKMVQEMLARKTGKKVFSYYATERDIEDKLQLYRKNM